MGKHLWLVRERFAESALVFSTEETDRELFLTSMCDSEKSATVQ